jgi:TPR repeat protein
MTQDAQAYSFSQRAQRYEAHTVYEQGRKQLFSSLGDLWDADDTDGIMKHMTAAYEYFAKAAEMGCPCAMHQLASIYSTGNVPQTAVLDPYLPIDFNKAVYWGEKASSLQTMCAENVLLYNNPGKELHTLGAIYAAPSPLQDMTKSAECYRQAALEFGYTPALKNYGDYLLANQGSKDAGLECIRQFYMTKPDISARDQEAMQKYGVTIDDDYLQNKELRKKYEYEFLLNCLMQSAKRHNIQALMLLLQEVNGKRAYDYPDLVASAQYLFQQLTPETFMSEDPLPYLNMARYLKAEKEYTHAVAWLKKACEYNLPDAFGEMGTLYYFGAGVEKDQALAAKYFAQGAKLDELTSMVMLSKMLAEGEGVAVNIEEAQKLQDRASQKTGFLKLLADLKLYYSIDADLKNMTKN